MNKKSKSQKGFTLIELLIVITIIGILSAMLLPHLGSAQDKAKEAAVKSVMHSVQLALESAALDTSAYPAGNNIPLVELVALLTESGSMTTVPKNPFTNQSYNTQDSSGQIFYSYNENSSAYILAGYGKSNAKVILTLTNG